MSANPEFPLAAEVMGSWQGVPHVTARIAAWFRAACARHEARRSYNQLLEADEQILRDIGVTRGDVREALSACR